MKKILITFFMIFSFFYISNAQEFSYQLLGPFNLYGENKFSEYYWKGDAESFKKYCLETVQECFRKIYSKEVKDLLTVSSEIKDDETLKNTIYVRANISRMQLSFELLGKENFQYALRSTGGIEFFNARTGEVFFSKIYTIIQPKQVIKGLNDQLSQEQKNQFYELFKNNIRELFTYLFEKSKMEYKPGIIKANIIKTLSPFIAGKTGILESRVILNKGRLQGIAERQQFKFLDSKNIPSSVKVKVIEIQDNYSIGSILAPKQLDIKPGQEILRSGGAEISAKFPVRMMVQSTEFLDKTQINEKYCVDPGFITQIVHDNLSDNSSFAMLPYGSIAEQQLESTKGGEKEEEVIGNRQRPDVYVKCIISKAFVYSTQYEGGQYLKLVVSPVLIFYDVNLGNVLYVTSRDEESLQVIKEGERIANISEQFEILTKNAIYEVTKIAKEQFSLLYTKGLITSVSGNKCEIQIETGQLGKGNIFRIFKAGDDVIDPVSGKNLGKLLSFSGNMKMRDVKGKTGSGEVLFSSQNISNGDILLANSDKNLNKGMVLIQPTSFKLSTSNGIAYNDISERAIEISVILSLVNSGRFNVILPENDLKRIKIEQIGLEPGGQFKVKTENEEKGILKPEVKLATEFLVFPPEVKSEDNKKISIGEYFICNASADGKQLVRKGKKQDLVIEGGKSGDKVKVGSSEQDFPKHYIDMLRSLSLTLSNVIADELQNILK